MPADRLERFLAEQRAQYSLDPSVPLPLFSRMRASSDGDVWLPDFVAQELRVERHPVVGRDKAALGAAVFPRPFHVLDANDRFVLGVHADELEVLSAAVYEYRTGS